MHNSMIRIKNFFGFILSIDTLYFYSEFVFSLNDIFRPIIYVSSRKTNFLSKKQKQSFHPYIDTI